MNWYRKSQEQKEELYLQTPDQIHNNYGLVLISENQDKLKEFITECRSLPKEFHTFWQSGSNKLNDKYPSFQYFEFWADESQQDNILSLAQKIANKINLELDIK